MTERLPQANCFYCGKEMELVGTTQIITEEQTYEFEYFECDDCKLRYLVEKTDDE